MTTTVVRNSIVGDQWIHATSTAVPMQRVVDDTGALTGDILTGPVRLAFDNLFTLPAATPKMKDPKYGSALLFTPYADFSLLYEEYYAVCAREFPDYYDAGSGQYFGLHSPFRDQGEKAKFGGFTPGCTFMTSSSKFKPPVIDARSNPIVDPAKVYPGVWAICALNSYAYKDALKKGVGFGLQSVMIIGDDTSFGGAAPDTKVTFKGVGGAITAPVISPGAVGGMPPGGPPGAPTMPSAPPGGTYAPTMPSAPPGGAQYTMPGAATADPRGAVPDGFASWAEYDDMF